MTEPPTIEQLHNLADRAQRGLTADETARLREGINALAAARAEPSPATLQPTITDIHTWDGTHTLPDWLHQDGAGLVLPGRDDDTRPQPGWMLVRWSDGHVTVASPQVAARVYGPDGMRGRLERAEAELADRAAADSADAAAGSYALRAERVEAQLARVYAYLKRHEHRVAVAPIDVLALLDEDDPAIAQPEPWLHILFTSPDPTTANTSALAIADHLAAEFDGVSMRITTNAVEDNPPTAAPGTPVQPVAPTGLRDQLAAAFRDAACPGDCGLTETECARTRIQPEVWHHGALAEVSGTPELLADTALAAVAPQLAALAAYENAITWHTDCLSCARILDSSIRETERAEKAQDTLALIGERCDTADVLHKAITTADVRAWLKGTRCARQAAAEQPRTTGNNPAGGTPTGDRL